MNRRRRREEPSYVRTNAHDGRKYVDVNEFFEDGRVIRQVRRLAANVMPLANRQRPTRTDEANIHLHERREMQTGNKTYSQELNEAQAALTRAMRVATYDREFLRAEMLRDAVLAELGHNAERAR